MTTAGDVLSILCPVETCRAPVGRVCGADTSDGQHGTVCMRRIRAVLPPPAAPAPKQLLETPEEMDDEMLLLVAAEWIDDNEAMFREGKSVAAWPGLTAELRRRATILAAKGPTNDAAPLCEEVLASGRFVYVTTYHDGESPVKASLCFRTAAEAGRCAAVLRGAPRPSDDTGTARRVYLCRYVFADGAPCGLFEWHRIDHVSAATGERARYGTKPAEATAQTTWAEAREAALAMVASHVETWNQAIKAAARCCPGVSASGVTERVVEERILGLLKPDGAAQPAPAADDRRGCG